MKIPFKVDLTGKTAIVTGGSGTLCSAMAYGLAVSGAKTAIIGRNQEKLLKVVNKLTEDALNEYGKDVIVKGYSCNVTDKNELEKVYSLISSELGTCDILINGAGGNQPGAIASTEMLKKEKGEDDYSFWNLDEDKINEYFTNNFKGDCLLAVGDEELIKIHFHTNEPWKVLEYCSQIGEIYDIVIEDMDRQARGLKG